MIINKGDADQRMNQLAASRLEQTRVMPANASIQNTTTLQGLRRRFVVSPRLDLAFAGMTGVGLEGQMQQLFRLVD